MKVYLLVTEEYYDGYVVYAASETPIYYVGSIGIPAGGGRFISGKIQVKELDKTDILRRRLSSFNRTEGYGWEIVPATWEKDETKYKYKAACEFLGRSE
jgi:hypothetical protein